MYKFTLGLRGPPSPYYSPPIREDLRPPIREDLRPPIREDLRPPIRPY